MFAIGESHERSSTFCVGLHTDTGCTRAGRSAAVDLKRARARCFKPEALSSGKNDAKYLTLF